MQKFIAGLLILLSLNSCNTVPPETTLILDLEQRIFSKDIIVSYQAFENTIVKKTYTHNTYEPEKLFKTQFKSLGEGGLKELKSKISELKELDYHNSFPWKEDYSKRSDVYKFQFLKEIQTNAFNKKDSVSVLVPQTYYYYSGLQNGEVFKSIIELVSF